MGPGRNSATVRAQSSGGFIGHLRSVSNIQAVPALERESMFGVGYTTALHVGNPVSITPGHRDFAASRATPYLSYFDAGVVENMSADNVGSVVALYSHSSFGISVSSYKAMHAARIGNFVDALTTLHRRLSATVRHRIG